MIASFILMAKQIPLVLICSNDNIYWWFLFFDGHFCYSSMTSFIRTIYLKCLCWFNCHPLIVNYAWVLAFFCFSGGLRLTAFTLLILKLENSHAGELKNIYIKNFCGISENVEDNHECFHQTKYISKFGRICYLSFWCKRWMVFQFLNFWRWRIFGRVGPWLHKSFKLIKFCAVINILITCWKWTRWQYFFHTWKLRVANYLPKPL